MPVFSPFHALRYADTANAVQLIAPPYDVLSDAQREALENQSPHNSVRIDFPHGKTDPNAYEGVDRLVKEWTSQGVLRLDDQQTFTVYRMTAKVGNRTTTTTGVLGALGLEQPGTGDILPHEQTTPKDKADRLSLLRSARINTSPIWGLSLSAGLGGICDEATKRPADLSAVDDGVLHEAWVVRDSATIEAITASVAANPIVIADGHHRLETALTYQAERNADDNGAAAILAFIVELAPEELEIRPIHRMIDAPAGTDVAGAFSAFFTLEPTSAATPDSVDAALTGPALQLITPEGTWLATPRTDVFGPEVELDAVRVATTLASMPDTSVRYHHDAQTVIDAVANGTASAGVFVRPVRIDQIRGVAQTRTRMPPKATFFWPKPRTGVLFRPLDAE